LVNIFKMEDREKVINILSDLKNKSNKELIFGMDFLSSEFEQLKVSIVELTKHLDASEECYNRILKEYESRK
jgi:hypothetical protein